MNDSIVYALNMMCDEKLLVKGLVIFGSEILPFIALFLVGGWVVFSKKKQAAIPQAVMVLLAALLAVGIADFLKYWIGAPRPFVLLDGIRGTFEHDPFGSFPSAHMTFFTALAAATFKKSSVLSGMLFAAAGIIGLSRIAAGLHFPIDIIGGFFLGLAVAVIVEYLDTKYRDTYSLKRKLLFWK